MHNTTLNCIEKHVKKCTSKQKAPVEEHKKIKNGNPLMARVENTATAYFVCERRNKKHTQRHNKNDAAKKKNGTRINRCEESKRGKAKVFSALRK